MNYPQWEMIAKVIELVWPCDDPQADEAWGEDGNNKQEDE